jgi:hypothetical protein
MPFEEIAPIVSRTPDATRQLASRARRRVQGSPPPEVDLAGQRRVVDAFITALRSGNVQGLIAVLAPEVVVRFGDPTGKVNELAGGHVTVADTWAKGATAFAQFADLMSVVLVDGSVGLVMAPKGRVVRALRFTFDGDRIALAEVIADRARLDALDIATLTGAPAEPAG